MSEATEISFWPSQVTSGMQACMYEWCMRKKNPFLLLNNKRRICYALLLSLWLYHAYHELNWVYFLHFTHNAEKMTIWALLSFLSNSILKCCVNELINALSFFLVPNLQCHEENFFPWVRVKFLILDNFSDEFCFKSHSSFFNKINCVDNRYPHR